MHSERFLGYIAWVMVCLLWGGTYIAIRAGVQDFPPFLFAGLRFLPAGLILIGWRRAVGVAWPQGREWRDLLIPGFLMLVCGNAAVVYSEQFVPGGITAIIVALTPLWMVTLASLLPRGERLSFLEFLGLLLGFCGLFLLIQPELAAIHAFGDYLHGIVWCICASLVWAIGSVYISRHQVKCGPIMGAGIQTLAAGLILTLVGTAAGEWHRVHITSTATWSLVYLIIGGSVGGYAAYMYALSNLPVGIVSTYAYVNPVVALVCGAIVLDERIDMRVILSTTVILAGVALVNRDFWSYWRKLSRQLENR